MTNMAMLSNGAARAIADAGPRYRAAEEQARKQKLGLWQ